MRSLIIYSAFCGFLMASSITVSQGDGSLPQERASGVTSNPLDAANNTYDYIIVGGGLTGLTVASRLSEDPQTTVLVIETGGDDRSNDLVRNIYTYGQAYGTSLDWYWPSDDNRNISGGRTLGGSSSINGATWTRGLDVQYDAWGSLLEEDEAHLDWSWDNLFGYMKKAEGFTPPNDQQREKGADSIGDYHGFSGPVQATFPDEMFGGPQQGYFAETIQSVIGITKSRDLNGGRPNCVSFVPNSLNPHDNYYRSSSAAAYLTPVESTRTNWLTLVNHHVSQLLWTLDGSKFAHGVRFKQSNNTGPDYEAYARKEVILAAGAINTPALLQRSGVGDPAHLSSLGIEIVLDIPTVGKNLQEQTNNQLAAGGSGFDVGGKGPSDVIAFPNLYELFGSNGTTIAERILHSLDQWAESQQDYALSKKALKAIYDLQADLIVNQNAPVVELIFITASQETLGSAIWTLLPFSRGWVKITTTDPFAKPQIQANYFSVDVDLQIQVASARLMRKIFQTPPLSTLLTGEIYPGFTTVPNTPKGGSDSDWETWLKGAFMPNSHPLATCAMMKRSLGGVVDGRLKLYGAKNVRIVDASIMPTQISGHLSSTLYGIAEKAVDLIKSGV